MRALIATRPGTLEPGDVPIPACGARQVLIETRVSAVSPGSELRALFEGTRFPRIGGTGYMAAGVVREVGADVTNFAPGDAVQFTCSEPVGPHSQFCVAARENAAHLPDGVSLLAGACAYWGVPPYRGILGSGVQYYDDLAVIGLGPLGQCAVQLLRPIARRLLAVDLVPSRRDLALALGADLALDPADGNLSDAVGQMMPRGPRVVIELSGSQPGLELALRLCAPRGTVVVIGVLPPLTGFQLFRPLQDKGIRLVPIARRGDSLDPAVDRNGDYMADVLDMIQRGKLDVERLATWVAPWTDGPELIPRLRTARDEALGVALTWPE
ncbi:MAG: zinc-binding dehydrogenase [Thermomicrobiales bacterium]